MRPAFRSLPILLAVLAVLDAPPALAQAAAQSQVLEFPNGRQVTLMRGPARPGWQDPAPAVPATRTGTLAVSGRTLWLVDSESGALTACFVLKTSYVDGYRIRCVETE